MIKKTDMKSLTKAEKKVAVMVLMEYGESSGYSNSVKNFIHFHKLEPVEVEVGKVYKVINNKGNIYLFCHKNFGKSYGFSKGEWTDIGWHTSTNDWNHDCIISEATKEEWADALIQEAKKRCYTKSNFKSIDGINDGEFQDGYFSCYENAVFCASSCHGGMVCYRNGKWAEIISNPIQEQIDKLQNELDELKKLV